MSKNICVFIATLFFFNTQSWSIKSPTVPYFNIIPLGTSGGVFENNLSAYLVSPSESKDWLLLDAGTVCSHIDAITDSLGKKFGIQSTKEWFQKRIKGYMLSHAHLDHVSGLVICSPADSSKQLYALDETIDNIKNNLFNGKIWPNFANEGAPPQLNKYQYTHLKPQVPTQISAPELTVTAFPLSHGAGIESTAFLLTSYSHHLLYLGDTGADAVEHSTRLQKLWQSVAPLIQNKTLTTLLIECSYSNAQADDQLYGHLNPKWLLFELNRLAHLVEPNSKKPSLKGLTVIVTHIKQGFEPSNNAEVVLKELNQANDLGIKFIIPKMGMLLNG